MATRFMKNHHESLRNGMYSREIHGNSLMLMVPHAIQFIVKEIQYDWI